MTENLVEIRNLRVEATTDAGRRVEIIKGVSLDIAEREIVALIGESGSGKTTIAMTLMGYARQGCSITGGEVRLAGVDMVRLSEAERADIRGMKAVHVLVDADEIEHPSLGIRAHCRRQRRLDEDAVVHIASVQALDECQCVRKRRGRRQALEVGSKTQLARRPQLVADVDFGSGIVSYEHHTKPGRPPMLRPKAGNPRLHFLLQTRRERLTVQHPCCHVIPCLCT